MSKLAEEWGYEDWDDWVCENADCIQHQILMLIPVDDEPVCELCEAQLTKIDAS